MVLGRKRLKELYDASASYYQLTTVLYRLIGLRMQTYRALAVDALRLRPGGRVVELGCGTGINFPLLLEKLGPDGKLVGVDLSAGMLDIARKRVEKAGWRNVELVEQDIATFSLPRGLNGILATGVFGYLPEYEEIIRDAADALSPGGRLVLLDGRRPDRLPWWLFRLVLLLGRPFGFTEEYFAVRPWLAVQRWFEDVSVARYYGGMIYIAAGTAP